MPQKNARDIIKCSWSIVKEHLSFLVGLAFAYFIFNTVWGMVSDGLEKNHSPILALLNLVLMAISVVFSMGVFWVSLKIVRKEKPVVSHLWETWRRGFHYITVSFLYSFIITIGLVLFIIPGVYWAVRYSQVFLLILGEEKGIFDVFKESARLTEGSKWTIVRLYLLLALLNVLGALIFFIGLLVTLPITWISIALLYSRLSEGAGMPKTVSLSGVSGEPTSSGRII